MNFKCTFSEQDITSEDSQELCSVLNCQETASKYVIGHTDLEDYCCTVSYYLPSCPSCEKFVKRQVLKNLNEVLVIYRMGTKLYENAEEKE